MIWAMVIVYFSLFILLYIPVVQSFIGKQVAQAIATKLGTKVEIGRVDVGLFNRVIINNALIYDQSHKKMLEVSRLSVKIDLSPLAKGRISISSAQLFGMKADLYKKSKNTSPNFQFVLDSLKSKDGAPQTPLDLNINSLILRHGQIVYNQLDAPRKKRQFTPKHLFVSGLSSHIVIHKLTNDSLSLHVKRLSFEEQSGLHVANVKFKLQGSTKRTVVKDFNLFMDESRVLLPEVEVNYPELHGQKFLQTLHGKIEFAPSVVTPCDFAAFSSVLRQLKTPIYISGKVKGNTRLLNIRNLFMQSYDDGFLIKADGYLKNLMDNLSWYVSLHRFSVRREIMHTFIHGIGKGNTDLSQWLLRLGDISYQGKIMSGWHRFLVDGVLNTDAGNIHMKLDKKQNDIIADIKTRGIDLQRILANSQFGDFAADISVKGKMQAGHDVWDSDYLKIRGNVAQLAYKGYTYKNIDIDGLYQKKAFSGKLSIDDPNGRLTVDGSFDFSSHIPSADFIADVHHLNPSGLRLSNQWPSATFDFQLKANMRGKLLNQIQGTMVLQDFTMQSPKGRFQLQQLQLQAGRSKVEDFLSLDADFGYVDIKGKYNYSDLLRSVSGIIRDRLPTLSALPRAMFAKSNKYVVHASVSQTDWLKHLMGVDFQIHAPVVIKGDVDDANSSVTLDCVMPTFEYQGSRYQDFRLAINTKNDTLEASAAIKKMTKNGKTFDLNLFSSIVNNKISSHLAFDNNQNKQHLSGNLSAVTQFFEDEKGRSAAHMIFYPSKIHINDTIWDVEPSDIVYNKDGLIIDHFSIGNRQQHVIIAGRATKSPHDTVHIDLKEVDVDYISRILNIKGVDFGGKVSGEIAASSIFGYASAMADISVNDFTFSHGRMGRLAAYAEWNKHNGRIDINAIADEGPLSKVFINGYLDLSPGYLNLLCDAHNSRVEFLETYLSGVLTDVEARTTGKVRVFGPLNDVNLSGDAFVSGGVKLQSTNVNYMLRNARVLLEPDLISIKEGNFVDMGGNEGIIDGKIYHHGLKNWRYDIGITADNILAYDVKDFGENTFCGTIYASGDCRIKGGDGETTIDIDVTPEAKSVLKYNVSSPDAIKNQSFITWHDRSKRLSFEEIGQKGIAETQEYKQKNGRVTSMPSNLFLNFLINTTPDLTLRLIMNEESGDYIDLNGNGVLRASYFNKGAFNIFGNYVVDHGIYKMTIQNVIRKDFQFLEGGSISFGGDPYLAAINLKAKYPVNGVSLSSLNIGRSFSSNNIRVNCLMNITGTARQPQVDFDLEMPTVSNDVQQMIRSYINSEEELNQQVIYLLTIGRFYAQETNNSAQSTSQTQTSLAMQSLLSGTLSQQLNNILSSVVNTDNWNFGTNISTGDEGWNNAEYEGILSGRLFNNRLLINGQFGYRDNANATTSFIGDFDIRYLLFPSGNVAIKVYNQTNDRYFTRSSLNTQGLGIIMKKDFNKFKEIFSRQKQQKKSKKRSLSADTVSLAPIAP